MTMVKLPVCHAWCDRRCERCPLQAGCPVATSTLMMTEALERAVMMAEQVCREEGIQLDELPAPPPPGPRPMALQRAGLEWASTYSALVGWDATALMVVGKLARIASEQATDEDEVGAADLCLNVLLVERLLIEARALVGARRTSAQPDALAKFEAVDRALRAWLAPWSAAISASDRLAIGALGASGCAPSPFSIRSR